MFLLFILIIIALFILLLFSSPRLSPIPYFPSNKKDLPLIVKAFRLKNNQIVVDLGAGDGRAIFTAANQALKQNLNTKFIAIEINPILFIILQLKKLFHQNRNNIEIIWGDLFKINIKCQISKIKNKHQKSNIKSYQSNIRTIEQYSNITIYLYISPRLIEKAIKNLKLKIKNFSIVSYMYPVKFLKPAHVLNGVNKVFCYYLHLNRGKTEHLKISNIAI